MRNSLALVTVIIGTRPEAIKLAPVIKAFQSNSFCKVRVVLTGQHKELVDEVLTVFNIKYAMYCFFAKYISNKTIQCVCRRDDHSVFFY